MAELSKGTKTALWILIAVLGLLYLFAGGSKLVGGREVVENFHRWGYSDGFRVFVGIVEVVGAVLLLIPRTATIGAAGLGAIMLGAVYTHLNAGEVPMALLPLVLLVLLCIVGAVRRRELPAASLTPKAS